MKRRYWLPFGLLFVFLILFNCSSPLQNETDFIELESVWQYLKTYSIYQDSSLYQDRIPKDAFEFTDPSLMLLSVKDTLKGNVYTKYFEEGLTKKAGIRYLSESAVDFYALTDSCCMIAINTFDDDGICAQFNTYLNQIARYPNIIIDLRNNLGGDLLKLDTIIEAVLPAGKHYIHARERIYERNIKKAYTLSSDWVSKNPANPAFVNKHFAVLINGSTASAAEILAAALKDCLNAPLIGERSYGKGMGQIRLVRRGRPGLQITYLQLAGVHDGKVGEYHHIGIKPDYAVNTADYNAPIIRAVQYLQPSVAINKIELPFKRLAKIANDQSGCYKTILEDSL